MKKLLFITVVVLSFACLISCDDKKSIITPEGMIGKWLIKDKIGGFTTDCERNEYIVFNADSTLLRHQCSETTGTWSVQNGKLVIHLPVDSTYANSSYSCELITPTEIKVSLKSSDFPITLWATYKKE